MPTPTSKREVKNVVHYARQLLTAWERREKTSKWATLSEMDALDGLDYSLGKIVQRKDAERQEEKAARERDSWEKVAS